MTVAYDEGLAERIRTRFSDDPGCHERKMFGGLAFMFGGHMAFGVVGHELMVRVGPERYEQMLQLSYAREMNFTGRPMKGMVFVATDGFESDEKLAAWLELGTNYVRSLPPKTDA